MELFGRARHFGKANLGKIMTVLFVMILIANVGWVVKNKLESPWAPLPVPAVQTVRLEHQDVKLQDGTVRNLPVLQFDPAFPELHLPTHGKKCTVDPDESVNIVSTTWYETTSPTKETVQTANGTSTRQGCVEKDYNNLVPYVFINVFQGAVNNGPVVARLYGVETPRRDDGTTGVPRRWESEEFAIVKKQ